MTVDTIGIAIVAPAGCIPDSGALERGIARLEGQGHLVHNYYVQDARCQRFGGTDEARLAQLNAAIQDPDVQLIMALRGGYGMSRLLPHIDFAALAASGKRFTGFSDITALHMALYARTGAISFAGPMLAGDFGAADVEQFTLDDFWRCLAGPGHEIAWAAPGNPALDVRGTAWGGNLAMVNSLLGTPYFPHIDGGILYLEDIGEHPYRIERMLLQLMQAGVLERQQAIVLGDFSGYQLASNDNGYDFDTMLAFLRATLPVPVLTGLPFGHIARRVTIPFGAQAHLVSGAQGVRLALTDYPALRRAPLGAAA